MAAGIATLCQLKANREQFYRQLDETSGKLVAGIITAAKEAGVAMTANRVGSMFTFFFTDKQVKDWESAATCDTAKFGRFHGAMMDAGVWLPPSQFEAAFLSIAHTQGDIDDTVAAAREKRWRWYSHSLSETAPARFPLGMLSDQGTAYSPLSDRSDFQLKPMSADGIFGREHCRRFSDRRKRGRFHFDLADSAMNRRFLPWPPMKCLS